ncbi:hypothetical protein ACFXJ8_02035 [Nonomuraea sp. NPDC059194]|uniref:hypothetical protein n=1 Tax=Nonomuraea sp. NPDC059194 TaxID=3346764 RepID=UPI0036902DAD
MLVETAKWGAAVLTIRRVACMGAFLMLGVAGCSASAQTATPSGTATTTATSTATTTAPATATAPATRQNIDVRLNPDKVTAGDTSTVWILANCPVPTDGPEHSGTATSKAFLAAVPLDPVPPPTPTATPGTTATPAPVPWVRGDAQISGTVKRGSYPVNVKCDGTNDTGKATLRVVAAGPTDEPTSTGTAVPTKAPGAGGGGTFAKDGADESGIPLGPAGVLLGLALAAGLGLALRRRRG